jgi:hypothetical protein
MKRRGSRRPDPTAIFGAGVGFAPKRRFGSDFLGKQKGFWADVALERLARQFSNHATRLAACWPSETTEPARLGSDAF